MVQVKGNTVQPTYLDIAEVAERTGLTPSALRFYERKGLVEAAARNGLRRAYEPKTLDRLRLISCAQAAGFTLAQIASFLTATPSDTELRRRMAERARELDQDIARLSRMRASLRHAATCRHTPLVDCPHFKRALDDDAGAGGEGGRLLADAAGAR